MIKLEIANLIIQVNIPIKVLPDNMYSFLYKGSKDADVFWDVEFHDKFNIADVSYIKNNEVVISKTNEKTIFKYNKDVNVPFVIIAKNEFRDCTFYVTKNYENYDKYNKNMEKQMKDGLYKAFKEMFIYACVYNNRLPIESASVVYKDKAYLFSAKKGVGKSTQAKLWEKDKDCEIFNDRLAIVSIKDEETKAVDVYNISSTSNDKRNSTKIFYFIKIINIYLRPRTTIHIYIFCFFILNAYYS